MKNQLKKLTVNKETLRDLTTQNAGDVRGGDRTLTCGGTCGCSWGCHTAGCTVTRGKLCHAHGKTYNKKCGY